MHLLVGLGNPGPQYANNRHNIGFKVAEEIARTYRLAADRARFQSKTNEGTVDGHKVLVLRPQTYMNESGRAVGEAMRFFKLTPADVIVFYDELDLALGKLRVKTGGGAAGHNGIRSLISHIGEEFIRVRIGIGHPGDKARVHGHVLGDFAKADEPDVTKLIAAAAAHLPCLLDGDAALYLNRVALDLQPPKPPKPKPQGADDKTPKD